MASKDYWVRMRVRLKQHPKVLGIVAFLRDSSRFHLAYSGGAGHVNGTIILQAVLGALFNVWSSIHEEMHDNFYPNGTYASLDELTGMPDFAQAMSMVDWLRPSSDPPGLLFPNYTEWNAPSNSSERSRRCRHRQNGQQSVACNADATLEGAKTIVDDTNATLMQRDLKTLELREELRKEKEDTLKSLEGEGDGVNQHRKFAFGGVPPPGWVDPFAGFAQFWVAYPKKVAKIAAEKAWHALKPNAETLGKVLAALDKQKCSEQWLRERGRYIPNPATWLNQRRWEDDLSPLPPTAPSTASPVTDGTTIKVYTQEEQLRNIENIGRMLEARRKGAGSLQNGRSTPQTGNESS